MMAQENYLDKRVCQQYRLQNARESACLPAQRTLEKKSDRVSPERRPADVADPNLQHHFDRGFRRAIVLPAPGHDPRR
jgi:hypothetical protein